MGTIVSPRPDAESYRESVTAEFPAVVQGLVAILGKKLTAYIAGAKDVRAVDRWISGREPYRVPQERVRLAYQIARMLASKEDPSVVQAWFIGLNPDLNDRAPILFFRDEDFETSGPQVLGAARSFLNGG